MLSAVIYFNYFVVTVVPEKLISHIVGLAISNLKFLFIQRF